MKSRRFMLKCLGLLVPLGVVTLLWLCSFWRGSLITLELPFVGGCGAMLNSGGLVLNWAAAHGEDGPHFRHRIVGVELLSEWPVRYEPQMFIEYPGTVWFRTEWSHVGFKYMVEQEYNLAMNKIYCHELLVPRWCAGLMILMIWVLNLPAASTMLAKISATSPRPVPFLRLRPASIDGAVSGMRGSGFDKDLSRGN